MFPYNLFIALILAVAHGAHAEDSLWVELDAPRAGSPPERIGWVELRGRVHRADRADSDVDLATRFVTSLQPPGVMIAIDVSQSSLLPTGDDYDGDGVVGELKRGPAKGKKKGGKLRDWRGPFRHWSTDWDDAVTHAQIEIARLLIEDLDRREVPVGLLTFTDRTRTRAPLGPAAYARGALDHIFLDDHWTGARIHLAVVRSMRLLEPLDEVEGASIILISDGIPNASKREYVWERSAKKSAKRAAGLGVRVHSISLGEDLDDLERNVLPGMAEMTGGIHLSLKRPRDFQRALERSRETVPPAALRIRNLSSGQPARAERIFSDGSFDGIVPLVRGENRLQVWVRSEHGDETTHEQVVWHEPGGENEDLLAAREMLERLRARTIETELASPDEYPERERTLRVDPE